MFIRTPIRHLLPLISLAILASAACAQSANSHPTRWAIAIHGGAGEEEWQRMELRRPRKRTRVTGTCSAAGRQCSVRAGDPSTRCEAAIEVLEDDPLFNAGRGSAFDAEGRNEMDAAIMDGATLEAGSVAGVSATKNPIALARAVIEHRHT